MSVGHTEVTPVVGSHSSTRIRSASLISGVEKSTPSAPLNCKSIKPGDSTPPSQSVHVAHAASAGGAPDALSATLTMVPDASAESEPSCKPSGKLSRALYQHCIVCGHTLGSLRCASLQQGVCVAWLWFGVGKIDIIHQRKIFRL